MKKIITLIIWLVVSGITAKAQDTLYIYKNGNIVFGKAVAEIDSIIFYKPASLPTIVTDIDGNVYKTVKIGNREWMAENLRVTRFNDGREIRKPDRAHWNTEKSPALAWYGDDQDKAIAEKHGALYNWYTIKDQQICPTGWHVPIPAEWDDLELYLINNGYNFDGSVYADKSDEHDKTAKALSAPSTLWEEGFEAGSPGNTDYPAMQNKTGFSALPSGLRGMDGEFTAKGHVTLFWINPVADLANPADVLYFQSYRTISHNDVSFGEGDYSVYIGLSVRCIKNQ